MRCTNPHFTLDEKCEKLKLNAVSNNFDLVENDNATQRVDIESLRRAEASS